MGFGAGRGGGRRFGGCRKSTLASLAPGRPSDVAIPAATAPAVHSRNERLPVFTVVCLQKCFMIVLLPIFSFARRVRRTEILSINNLLNSDEVDGQKLARVGFFFLSFPWNL
jgi:hypothetical protein